MTNPFDQFDVEANPFDKFDGGIPYAREDATDERAWIDQGIIEQSPRPVARTGIGAAIDGPRQAEFPSDAFDDIRQAGTAGSAFAPSKTATMRAADPFRGGEAKVVDQGIGDLGKRAARGATEVAASVPEAAAIAGAGNPNATSLFAAEEVQRAEDQIGLARQRLADRPDMGEEDRQRIEAVIEAEQKKIDAYRPLIELADGPLKPAAKDRDLYKVGDKVRRASEELFGTPDPQFDDRFISKLAEGGGNMAGFVATTLATGILGGAGVGSALNTSAQYRRAIQDGATEEQAKATAYIGSVVGASEILPIAGALRLLPSPARTRVTQALGQRLSNAFVTAGEEGLQEAMAEIANNATVKGIYKPDQDVWEGAGESALIGAILGGGMGAVAPSAPRKPLIEQVEEEGRAAVDQIIQEVTQSPNDLPTGPVRQRPIPPQVPDAPAQAPARPPEVENAAPTSLPDVPEGSTPLDMLYPEDQTPAQSAPERPQEPLEGAEAPTAPKEPARAPTVEDTAPEAPSEPDILPVVDEDGKETGQFVRIDRKTGAVVPVKPETPKQEKAPEADTHTAPQPDVEAPVGDVAPDLDETQAKRPVEVLGNDEIASIETDADTFQYKGGGDAAGVTDRLRGVKQWDDNRTGIGLVYEYEDGRRVIVDGHQRLGLAKRLAEGGQNISLPVRVLREADGVTEAQARAIGAEKNIAEGSGSALDAAKVFRDTGKSAADMDLPMSSGMVRTADGLGGLSDDAFGMVNNDVASERDGAIVGRMVEDKGRHADILGLLVKLKPSNVTQAESIVRQAMQAEVTETQDSLFGEEEVSANLYLERAKVLDRALKDIGREITTFKTLVDRADTISGAGNVLQSETNAARLSDDQKARAVLEKQANTKGPISDALTEAAREYRETGKLGPAAQKFAAAVRQGEEAGGNRGAEAGPARDGDGPPQEKRVESAPERREVEAPKASTPAQRVLKARNDLAQAKKAMDEATGAAVLDAGADVSDARRELARALAEKGGRIELSNGNVGAVVTPMGDGFQITYFNETGFLSDTRHNTLESAVMDAVLAGHDKVSPGLLKKYQQGDKWRSPEEFEQARRQVEEGAAKGAGNFRTSESGGWKSIEYLEGGKPVGKLTLKRQEKPEVADIQVDPSHRRKGVATKLYDRAGIKAPSDNLSKDAFDFWNKRDPESVKNSLYQHYDRLMGMEVTEGKTQGTIVDVRNDFVSVKKGGISLPLYRADLEKLGLLEGAKRDAASEESADTGNQDDADWWTRASRENDGAEALRVLEAAGVAFSNRGRPWRDIRPSDQEKILAARDAAPQSEKGVGNKTDDFNAHETEQTPEGEQSLIPGVDPVTDRERLETQMNKPKDGGNAPPPSGRGDLFGDPMDRADLFDGDGNADQAANSDAAKGYDAERTKGGFYPRVETPNGQRTIRDKVYQTRDEANAAAKRIKDEREKAGEPKPLAPEKTERRTLEDYADRAKGRAHLYAEAGGYRYYIGTYADISTADARRKEMVAEYPDASFYIVDRADGTSINGDLGDFVSAQPAKQPAKDSREADATPAETKDKPAPTNRTEKIDDFGEKIAGAQKDRVSDWAEKLDNVPDAEIATVPLSKSWPKPDYQALLDDGVDPFAVAFIHAAHDAIPTKPRRRLSLKRWAEQVRQLRGFSRDLAGGNISPDLLREKLASTKALSEVMGRAALYEKFGHDKSLKDVRLSEGAFTVFMGERFDSPKSKWVAYVNGRIAAHGDTMEEAIEAFSGEYRKIAEPTGGAKKGGVKFEIRKYRADNRIFIGKKVGRDWIEVESNPDWDWKAARAYLAENQAALEEKFARMKALPPERGESNNPRIGEDHRGGADVTPEMFSETFGFRGVQFGNYVEGARRQQDMNEAYDALMDLAGVLDIPPKALSLNGELGLAFGARGSGKKAKAHYEPGEIVINLTKKDGAGSLAHEWWHGLDHYFAMQGGRKASLLTEQGVRGLNDGIRPEMVAAFQRVMDTIRNSDVAKRSRTADKRKSKPYFGTMVEMTARSFESYVIGKLQDQSASNDYLANILSEEAWMGLENAAGHRDQSWPYVRVSEMPEFREAFDGFFDTIETEPSTRVNDKGETVETVRLYQRQLDMFYSPLLRAVEGAKQKQAPAKDWKAIIAKMPGVKKAELEWLGVNEWLDAQDGQVSREDVAAFVRDSQIEIVENRLAGDELDSTDIRIETGDAVEPDWDAEAEFYLDEAREDLTEEYEINQNNGEVSEDRIQDRAVMMARERWEPSEYVVDLYDANTGDYGPTGFYDSDMGTYYFSDLSDEPFESGQDAIDAWTEQRSGTEPDADGPANFSEYTEDGGDNYREVLLRVPNLHESGKNEPRMGRNAASNMIVNEAARGRSMSEIRNIYDDPNIGKSPFVQPQHFEEPNIVVHARIKDRKGANGEKVLFVEEIQSDLASAWREGTEPESVTLQRRDAEARFRRAQKMMEELTKDAVPIVWQYQQDGNGDPRFTPGQVIGQMFANIANGRVPRDRGAGMAVDALRERDGELYDKIISAGKEIGDADRERLALGTEKTVDPSLPDTPFKEEATYTLMVKRLMRMAAEEGYDAIAWTPGYMQAERWDAAAQNVVDSVWWEPAPESTGAAKRVVLGLEGSENVVLVSEAGVVSGAAPVDGKPLSSLLGPKLAKQVMEESSGTVDGEKITFPDSGYAIAYDQQTKRAVDKLARKHGAKVTVDKSLPDFNDTFDSDRAIEDEVRGLGNDAAINRIVSMYPGNLSDAARQRAEEQLRRGYPQIDAPSLVARGISQIGRDRMERAFNPVQVGKPVWRVDLTDDLRKAALEPMAMFRREQAKTNPNAAKIAALMPALRKRLDKVLLKNVSLEFDPNMVEQGAVEFDRDGGIAVLIGNTLDGEATVNHETIHILRAMNLFTKSEWSALEFEARRLWMTKHKISERYGDLSEAQQIEEAIAEAFADYAGRAPNAGIKGAFAKIKRFFRAMKEALTGQGIRSVEDIFADVDSGRVGAREGADGEAGRKYQREQAKTDETASEAVGETVTHGVMPDTPIEQRKESFLRAAMSQPIDRVARIPFAIVGGLDQYGRWKPGKAIEAAVRKTVVDKEFSEDGAFRFMNPTLKRVRHGLIDRAGLPESYVEMDRQRALREAEIATKGKEHVQALLDGGMDADEAKVLQAILTGENVDNDAMKKVAKPIMQAIDDLGAEAVELGLISRESYERNRGTYLHRVYEKHEMEDGQVSRWAQNLGRNRRKKIIGNNLKGRGIFQQVDAGDIFKGNDDFTSAKMGVPQKGDRVIILDRVAQQDSLPGVEGAKGRTTRRVYWPANKPVPEALSDYVNRGEFEVREAGKKITLWRDFTKAEREQMGEILDARYLVAKTFAIMSEDLATGRFFKSIAEDETLARSQPPEGQAFDDDPHGGRPGLKRMWIDPELEWVKVPDTKIPKSNAYRYGALAGKYVRADVWRDLEELRMIQSPHFFRKMMTMWKLNKTARSPVVHMNNVMSNFILMDMADVRFGDLMVAAKEMRNNSELYQEAVANGAFGADMVTQEIRDNILNPLLQEMRDKVRDGKSGLEGEIGRMGRWASALGRLAKRADQKVVNAYQVEDQIFRMATYIRRRQQGASAKDAAIEGRDQFINYDIRAPWVNAARSTVLPFASYIYRAAPKIAQTAAERPWKLAKYFAIYYGLNALAYSLAPSDYDEEEERGSFGDHESGRSWFGTPHMLRMPYTVDGNPVFLNARRWIPGGDVFDTNNSDLPSWLHIGGPIMIGMELYFNKALFTGDEIVNDLTDTYGERATKRALHIYKSWIPSTPGIPGSWYSDKILRAAKGEALEWGSNEPYSLPEALSSSIGIKLKPKDVDVGYMSREFQFDMQDRELGMQKSSLKRQFKRKLISLDEYRSGLASIAEKSNRVEQERRKVFDKRR